MLATIIITVTPIDRYGRRPFDLGEQMAPVADHGGSLVC